MVDVAMVRMFGIPISTIGFIGHIHTSKLSTS